MAELFLEFVGHYAYPISAEKTVYVEVIIGMPDYISYDRIGDCFVGGCAQGEKSHRKVSESQVGRIGEGLLAIDETAFKRDRGVEKTYDVGDFEITESQVFLVRRHRADVDVVSDSFNSTPFKILRKIENL